MHCDRTEAGIFDPQDKWKDTDLPSADKKTTPSENSQNKSGRQRLWQVFLFVVSLLIFLALISYDPRDSDFLEGGLGRDAAIHNLIGYFGAYVSRGLLLLFGFSSYVLTGLMVLASSRRLFGRQGLRPILWDYCASILLIALGMAMLFGIWPDLGASLAANLNIGKIPGGVLGQRLCSPEGGWMRIILNPTGSAIVSITLVIVGLAVIWIYDWQDLIKLRISSHVQDDEPKEAGKSLKNRLAERRAAKLRQRDLVQDQQLQEKQAKAEPRPSSPEEASPRKKTPQKRVAAGPGSPGNRPKVSAKYTLPGLDLLKVNTDRGTTTDPKEIEEKKETLQETLDSFGIDAQVGNATSGPRVTLFEVLPAPGVKVERISQISNNIAMELCATSLRILTPIPGKNSVGIEVPNATAAMVNLHSLMSTPAWKGTKVKLPVLLGRNISGKVVILDLAKAPHLLIAGATGSGKSVCINVLIMSLLYRFSPEELRLIMIDPKVVEFRAYQTLPHLVVPVISDIKKVPLALRWVINEMQHRYHILAKVGARNLDGFNSRPKSKELVLDDDGQTIPDKLPYIVVIIDELADIMMTAKADVETSLARIAQLSRAVGIHTIIATQRPSVNVITGTIKANFPTRIAFQVTSQIDSRTILDGKGAEALLGRGDMLFRPPGTARLDRNQGALVDDDEIDRIVGFVADQAGQEFDSEVFKVAGASGGDGQASGEGQLSDSDEELIQQAIDIIVRDRRATTSYVQRCLRIGYNRAASIMETLEQRGVIGPQIGTAPREILIVSNNDENSTPSDTFDDDVPEMDVEDDSPAD